MDRKETFVRVVGLAAGLAGLVGSVRYGMQNKHPYAGVAVGVLVVAPVASALGAGLAAFVVGASPSAMLPMRAAAVPAIGPNGINLPTEGIRLPPSAMN